MKRIIYLAAVLLIVLSPIVILVGCSAEHDPEQVVSQICSAYGIAGRKYSSTASEDEDGYIGQRLESVIFDSHVPPSVEYCLVLHSKLDSLYEVGAFRCSAGEDRLYVRELVEKRLELLGATVPKGEGTVLVRGELVIYAYLPDVSKLGGTVDKILG